MKEFTKDAFPTCEFDREEVTQPVDIPVLRPRTRLVVVSTPDVEIRWSLCASDGRTKEQLIDELMKALEHERGSCERSERSTLQSRKAGYYSRQKVLQDPHG